MKLRQSIYITALVLSFGLVVGCSNDDNGTYMDDDMMMDDDDMMEVDFSGTFSQVDHIGRPGINTTLENANESEAFGITLEPEGGSETPTLEQLYTLGAVGA